MSDDDAKFFELRQEGKTYLSKVFTHGVSNLAALIHERSDFGIGLAGA